MNHLLFVFLEDFPQLVIQTINGLLIGSTLSWIEVLSPLTSFLSAVFAVHGVLYNAIDEEIDSKKEKYDRDGNRIAAKHNDAHELEVNWGTIIRKIICWLIPLIILFGGLIGFVIWTCKWVDLPPWCFENFGWFRKSDKGLM